MNNHLVPTAIHLKLIENREDLPDFAWKNEVLSALRKGPLLIICRETKYSGGYTLELINSEVNNLHLNISLVAGDPKPGALLTQVITKPWVYVPVGDAKTVSVEVNGHTIVRERSL